MNTLPDKSDASFDAHSSDPHKNENPKTFGPMGIFSAIYKSLTQMTDPRFRKVILLGIAGAFVVFVGLWTITSHFMAQIIWTDVPVIGWVVEMTAGIGFFEFLAGALFLAGMLFVTFFLFPAVMTGVMGIFTDAICEAVEDKHYPDLGPTRHILPSEAIGNALKFIGLVIGINLLALPLYAILFFMPPLNLIFFYLLNGYLLGREFFEQTAFRRLTVSETHAFRRKHRLKLIGYGAVIAFAMTIPIFNLIVPVIASAAMTHIFHHLPGVRDLMDHSAHHQTRPSEGKMA